jgi:hypothetical protein
MLAALENGATRQIKLAKAKRARHRNPWFPICILLGTALDEYSGLFIRNHYHALREIVTQFLRNFNKFPYFGGLCGHSPQSPTTGESFVGSSAAKSWAQIPELKEQGEPHAINGRIFGNLSGLEVNAGEHVRWYLFGLDSENDFHKPRWRGLRVLEAGHSTDVIEMLPASIKVADMQRFRKHLSSLIIPYKSNSVVRPLRSNPIGTAKLEATREYSAPRMPAGIPVNAAWFTGAG